jgi:zinc protease
MPPSALSCCFIALLILFASCPLPVSAAKSNQAARAQANPKPGPQRANAVLVKSDAQTGIAEYKLTSNNMRILLAERHATPVVTVMVLYHVGSRNEAVGYTGSTHFLEHMMFKGTAAHDPLAKTGIDDVLKPVGAINNATTSYDRTNYFAVLPAKNLELALELEADRMRNALLREKDRQSEMTVVRNELERNVDDAQTLLATHLFATAFQQHPYHHPIIGWRSDVEGVPIARLRQFYNDFYWPNNATLLVVGDFDSRKTLSMIISKFGNIPPSPMPFPAVYTTEPPQEGERRFVVGRGQDTPKVSIGWHVPAAKDKDTYPLEVAASLLGDDKRQSSRLYKGLVESGLASDVYAYNYSMKDPGLFTLYASATGGTKLPQLEDKLLEEVDKLANRPIDDAELERAKTSIWKRLKLSAADPVGLVDQVAEAIAVADWTWWVNLEDNIKAVRKEDVARVVQKYFTKPNRTVGWYEPKAPEAPAKQEEALSKPAGLLQLPAQLAAASGTDAKKPVSGSRKSAAGETARDDLLKATSTARSIASQVRTVIMKNGMTVSIMPIKGSGVVSISGKIRAGEYFRPSGTSGIPDMTAELLTKGSANLSKEALAQKLENLGTTLDFGVGNFWMDLNSDVVSEDLPVYLALLTEVLQHPKFAQDELDKSKKITEADLKSAMSDTTQVAMNLFYGSLYKPECVFYQKPFAEQVADVGKITPETLRAFHAQYVVPSNTFLSIVGDIDGEQALNLVRQNFDGWQGGAAAQIDATECARAFTGKQRVETAIADKTNIDITMGRSADTCIQNSDFYAMQIANSALGYDTISSRLAELRQKHGLTYGISSALMDNSYPGAPWVISLTVAPESESKALTLIDDIVSNYLKKGMTDTELKEESQRLVGEYIVSRLRTPKQIADGLTKYQFLNLGPQFMDEYAGKVQSVTLPQANQAIRKYFDLSRSVMSIAGSIKKK